MEQTNTKPKKKVGDIIVTIILVFAFICVGSVVVSKIKTGMPNLLGLEFFSVQTNSMVPTFYAGDLIIDKVVKDPADLEVGDIITFKTVINGYEVLNSHRIVSIEDFGTYYYFETKGDANSENDAAGVHSGDIVGVYVMRVNGLGKFFN